MKQILYKFASACGFIASLMAIFPATRGMPVMVILTILWWPFPVIYVGFFVLSMGFYFLSMAIVAPEELLRSIEL